MEAFRNESLPDDLDAEAVEHASHRIEQAGRDHARQKKSFRFRKPERTKGDSSETRKLRDYLTDVEAVCDKLPDGRVKGCVREFLENVSLTDMNTHNPALVLESHSARKSLAYLVGKPNGDPGFDVRPPHRLKPNRFLVTSDPVSILSTLVEKLREAEETYRQFDRDRWLR